MSVWPQTYQVVKNKCRHPSIGKMVKFSFCDACINVTICEASCTNDHVYMHLSNNYFFVLILFYLKCVFQLFRIYTLIFYYFLPLYSLFCAIYSLRKRRKERHTFGFLSTRFCTVIYGLLRTALTQLFCLHELSRELCFHSRGISI